MQTTFSKWSPLPWKPQKNTKNFKCSELDETFQKLCLTCVHIILRLRNFKMATVAMEIIFNISIMFLHYSSFIRLVLVLFVWGTFVTLCVTVTNISSCLWYTQSRTIYTSLETNTLTLHHRYDFKV